MADQKAIRFQNQNTVKNVPILFVNFTVLLSIIPLVIILANITLISIVASLPLAIICLYLVYSKKPRMMSRTAMSSVIQDYFLQNLLRGEYRDKVLFIKDRERFGLELAEVSQMVLICKLSPLVTAFDTDTYNTLNTSIFQHDLSNILNDEYSIRMTSDSLAIILRLNAGEDYKTASKHFINKFLNEMKNSERKEIFLV